VIATETFYPIRGRVVGRGRYFRLNDEIVAQYPTFFFAVVKRTGIDPLPRRP
jgi:hypothetical protein